VKKTRLSLFYLAGYLLSGGTGFLFFPKTMLTIFQSTGEYSDVMLRFVGVLLLSIGIIVVQLIRHETTELYKTTLLVRTVILIALTLFYLTYKDPLMIILLIIVGIGYIITFASYILDKKEKTMKIPDYVTVDEVKKVCKELTISDWTSLKEPEVLSAEAKIILNEVNTEGMNIDLEDFRTGLEVELEHGTRFRDANVTNNHPVLTGKIVLAHLKESLDYYKRLEVAELEGDLLKAVASKNQDKIQILYKKLSRAKETLAKTETEQLS
jgi:uncharacterized protein YjeT (DUF2065 family)